MAKDRKLTLYYVAFADPRTFENDALAHLLFIAHKASKQTREKIFRFFLAEYLFENKALADLSLFENWCKKKGYPCLPREETSALLADKVLFERDMVSGSPTYYLRGEQIKEIELAQSEYLKARESAVSAIKEQIVSAIGTARAVENIDIERILKEYLCGIFSEIRIFANYFRDAGRFPDTNSKTLDRYDWIIDKSLIGIDEEIKTRWKEYFIRGLKNVSQKGNKFISAIFYNVLAGYYLNRTFTASPYQLENLQKRSIFLDTNVLYTLRCKSSSYHARIQFFAERLKRMGVGLRLYPFSVDEFESSLEKAEKEYKKDPYSYFLLEWNPWIIQEFRSAPYKYLNDISVCRMKYSITKGVPASENIEKTAEELAELNIILEKEYKEFTREEKQNLWEKLRHLILSKSGDMEDYWFWSEKVSGYKENVINHDVDLLENVKLISLRKGIDSLGPLVLLLTIDSKLLKCQEEYPFVINTEQFLEFIMPYLFLADVPDEDPDGFPNLILSAQLGVHISFWRPSSDDYAMMALKDSGTLSKEGIGSDLSLFSRTISQTRLKEIYNKTQA